MSSHRFMAATLAIVLIVTGACTQEDVPDRTADARLKEEGPPGDEAALAVTGDTQSLFNLLDEQVTISGHVTDRISEGVILLRAEVLGFEPITIVVPSDVTTPDDDALRVVGTVREVDAIDDELDPATRAQIENERVVVAEEVRTIAEVEAEGDTEDEATEPADTSTTSSSTTTSTTSTTAPPTTGG